MVAIRELVEGPTLIEPRDRDTDRFRYVDIGSVDRESKRIVGSADLRVHEAPSRARQLIRSSDVLVSTVRPNLNAVALVPPELDGEIASTGFGVLRPRKGKLIPEYLFYFVQSHPFVDHLVKRATGASYPAVTDDDILDAQLSPPDVKDQIDIVRRLQAADRLRAVHRKELDMSGSLAGAAFLDTFGDPIRNPRNIERATLADVSLKVTDGEHLNPAFVPNGRPIVMAEQVEDWSVQIDDCKKVSDEDFGQFVRKCKPENGDLLLVSRGATIGRSCIVAHCEPFCLMGSVILIKPDRLRIEPEFLWGQIRLPSYRASLLQTSGSSAQQAIYLAHLRERQVLLPSLSDQQRFCLLIREYRRYRQILLETARQAEHLFRTLLQQVFG